MDPEKLAQRARKVISSFCIEECKSYCCRKGYLFLTSHEVDLVIGETNVQLKEKGHLTVTRTGDYSLFLGCSENGCPSLKEYKCKIHNNSERPKTCKDYPLFIVGNKIRLSSRCLAVRMNLFYPFIKKFTQLGYQILENSDFEDSDIYPPSIISWQKPSKTTLLSKTNKVEGAP